MKIKPLTVIMSNYNGGIKLKYSIQSILNQSFRNFEFKIIDDNSTDNSLSIIYEYAKKDKRIQVYKNKKKQGLPKNLNKLINYSKSKLIARMDSDDISTSERLKIQYNEILKHNLDILGTNCIYISENKKIRKKSNLPIHKNEIFNELNYSNPIIHSSVIFKKKSIIKIGCYDEKLLKCQDLDLWFRAKANNLNVKNLKKNLLIHHVKNYKSLVILVYIIKVIKKNMFKAISFKSGIFFIINNIISLIKSNVLQSCKN